MRTRKLGQSRRMPFKQQMAWSRSVWRCFKKYTCEEDADFGRGRWYGGESWGEGEEGNCRVGEIEVGVFAAVAYNCCEAICHLDRLKSTLNLMLTVIDYARQMSRRCVPVVWGYDARGMRG